MSNYTLSTNFYLDNDYKIDCENKINYLDNNPSIATVTNKVGNDETDFIAKHYSVGNTTKFIKIIKDPEPTVAEQPGE